MTFFYETQNKLAILKKQFGHWLPIYGHPETKSSKCSTRKKFIHFVFVLWTCLSTSTLCLFYM